MAKPSYVDTTNDASLARLVKTGAIFIREAGVADVPTNAEWVPADTNAVVGFYSEDGFVLTPVQGDTTELKGHNGDVLIAESDPGNWTVQFSGLEGNETTVSTYFDVDVAPDGSITVTTAAANKRYDIVTVGLDQLERPIVIHYPNVQISEREGITFNRTTLLAMNMTFRTFRGASATPYHFKAWGLAVESGRSDEWTVTVTGTPTGGSFKLAVDGDETETIVYNAAASAVASALDALDTVSGAAVTGSAGGPYSVTFTERRLLTADGSALTGGTNPDVTATAS